MFMAKHVLWTGHRNDKFILELAWDVLKNDDIFSKDPLAQSFKVFKKAMESKNGPSTYNTVSWPCGKRAKANYYTGMRLVDPTYDGHGSEA